MTTITGRFSMSEPEFQDPRYTRVATEYPKFGPYVRLLTVDFAAVERRVYFLICRDLCLHDIKRKAKYRRKFRRAMYGVFR